MSMSPTDIENLMREMVKDQQNRTVSAADKVKEKFGEDTTVIFEGKPMYQLNSALVLRQGIDVSELRALKSLHAEKLKYFKLMEETDDKAKLREYAKEVECIEFEMQKNWHFEQDSRFHEWWRVPKCTCPKMDNEDRRGTKYKVIDPECPVHGDGLAF